MNQEEMTELKQLLTELTQDVSELKTTQAAMELRLNRPESVVQRSIGREQLFRPNLVTMIPTQTVAEPFFLPVSEVTHNVSGSFVITRCDSNGILEVGGVAGTNLTGQTVEIFDGNGNKVAEIGTVDSNGKFDGRVGPPNPFRVGDTVIIRIGSGVAKCTAT